MVQLGTEVNREDTAPALPICPFGPRPCPVSPGTHGQCQQAFPPKLHSSSFFAIARRAGCSRRNCRPDRFRVRVRRSGRPSKRPPRVIEEAGGSQYNHGRNRNRGYLRSCPAILGTCPRGEPERDGCTRHQGETALGHGYGQPPWPERRSNSRAPGGEAHRLMVVKLMYAKPRGSFELSVKTRNLTWSYDRENSQWTVPINAQPVSC
jgi:hypothetical protein